MHVLESFYLSIKAVHILFVIAWMAGIMYLPRLFAYHKKHERNEETYAMFLVMERRLVNIIIIPSMIGTLLTGLALFLTPGVVNWKTWTPYVKFCLVCLLALLQFFLFSCRKDFLNRRNQRSEVFFRSINEVPFVLAILIVFLVVLKPF